MPSATIDDYDTALKVNPPLRTAEDAAALIEGVVDGTVDAIVTDHAPHAPWEKEDAAALIEGVVDGTVDAIVTDHAPHAPWEKDREFERAPFGMVGLETSLALVITHLVAPGKITWERAVELMSVRPREILRVERVAVEAGCVADLTVVDPDAAWMVDAERFASKSRNTGFAGAELLGRATDVYVAGYATVEDGAIVE